MKQKYYLLLLTILISCIGFANTDKDSLLKSTNTVKAHVSSPHDNVLDSVTKRLLRQINNAPTANKSNTSNIGGQFRSFPSLNEYNTSINAPTSPFGNLAEFTEPYLDQLSELKKSLKTNKKTDSIIKAGEELLDIIKNNQKFIEVMTGNELLEFPVGIKKDITQSSSINIGVIKATLYADYAEVDLFAELIINEISKKKLFFGATGVKISHQGGIYGEARLNLLSDVTAGLNGGQMALTFKGSFDKSKGTSNSDTYIIIDCEGKVKEIARSAKSPDFEEH